MLLGTAVSKLCKTEEVDEDGTLHTVPRFYRGNTVFLGFPSRAPLRAMSLMMSYLPSGSDRPQLPAEPPSVPSLFCT